MAELVEKLRIASSALVARMQFARRAGITFGGKRDIYSTLGYKRGLGFDDFNDRYIRGDIAARIIEAKPEATWRGGVEVIEDDKSEEYTTFETAFADLDRRLNIWPTLAQTDVLAGIGRYAVILIGAPGNLETPLGKLRGPDDVLYLQPYAENDASVSQNELITRSDNPRYGLPEYYHMKRLAALGETAVPEKKVHWTRIVHVKDGALDNNLLGKPRLERVWNRLDDLDKIAGGGSEAFWLRSHQGFQFDLDKDAKLSPEKEKEMAEEVDKFVNEIQRSVLTKGVTMNRTGSDVADISGPIMAIVSLISAATGIPVRILMGSERGELASTQDRDNWYDRITDRRVQYAHPFVIRPFTDRLIDHGGLPKPTKWETRWPDPRSVDDSVRADLTVKITKANQQQGEVIITPEEIRDRIWGLSARTDEQRRLPAPPRQLPAGSQEDQT
jgi:uncharacterized protein